MNALLKKKGKKGFTLIELIVVIAILAILAAIAVPRLLGFQTRAAEQADKQTAVQVRNAVALLYANGELFPVGATDAVADDTIFTINKTGVLAYASGDSFYNKKAGATGRTAIAAADAQNTIIGLTGTIALQGDKHIQITLKGNGEVIQELVTVVASP